MLTTEIEKLPKTTPYRQINIKEVSKYIRFEYFRQTANNEHDFVLGKDGSMFIMVANDRGWEPCLYIPPYMVKVIKEFLEEHKQMLNDSSGACSTVSIVKGKTILVPYVVAPSWDGS